jgi:hypothetical protein
MKVVLLACAVLALVGSSAAAAATGGSGTYTASGRTDYLVLFNSGSAPWLSFYLVSPAGTTFVGGATTAGESTARCILGQPDGTADEVECGPLSATTAPPNVHLGFVATLNVPAPCGASYELDVSTTGLPPYTRIGDVTFSGSCAALQPAAVTPPTLQGLPRVGHTLTATAPTWNEPPTRVGYQWQRCTASGCTAIKGATRLRLALDGRDAGHRVRIVATATIGDVKVVSGSAAVAVRR